MNDINKPILITGCARSGTSLTAGLIYTAGAWGGELSGPNRFNPKGMFENQKIRNQLVKPFLTSIDADPMGQHPLPDLDQITFTEEYAGKWRNWITRTWKKQGYNDGPVFYKGAKICLIWPLWAKAFPESKWVVVRRETEDIVNSCLRTSFMRAHQKRSGWLKWVAEHEKRFEEMADAKLNIREVWPQRLIAGDFTEIQQVINWLDLDFDLDASRSFVDPKLWRKWVAKRGKHGQKEN